MTLQGLFELVAQDTLAVLSYFFALPLFTLGMRKLSRGRGHGYPWKYVYTTLVYFACVPGTFSITLMVYSMFMAVESVVELNPLVYFVPPISMAITLLLIRREVNLKQLPGFVHLAVLLGEIALSLVIVLLLQHSDWWAWVVEDFWSLVTTFVIAFFVIRLIWRGAVFLKKRVKS